MMRTGQRVPGHPMSRLWQARYEENIILFPGYPSWLRGHMFVVYGRFVPTYRVLSQASKCELVKPGGGKSFSSWCCHPTVGLSCNLMLGLCVSSCVTLCYVPWCIYVHSLQLVAWMHSNSFIVPPPLLVEVISKIPIISY